MIIVQKIHKDICCKKLLKLLNDSDIDIEYISKIRGFGLYDCRIDNCPMCGKKFPVELYEFYNEIREKEFGITRENYHDLEKKDLIPKEFKTDEWWLKREHYPNFPTKHLTRKEFLKKIAYSWDFSSKEESLARYKNYLKTDKDLQKKIGTFCCTSLWHKIYDSINDSGQLKLNTKSLIIYEPEKRRFLLKNMVLVDETKFKKNKPKCRLRMQFYNCPCCGKELPKSLASLWFKIVTTEFGVTDISNQKQLAKKLPPEFLTEEWWKKRGL